MRVISLTIKAVFKGKGNKFLAEATVTDDIAWSDGDSMKPFVEELMAGLNDLMFQPENSPVFGVTKVIEITISVTNGDQTATISYQISGREPPSPDLGRMVEEWMDDTVRNVVEA